jgi:hypothetical protein
VRATVPNGLAAPRHRRLFSDSTLPDLCLGRQRHATASNRRLERDPEFGGINRHKILQTGGFHLSNVGFIHAHQPVWRMTCRRANLARKVLQKVSTLCSFVPIAPDEPRTVVAATDPSDPFDRIRRFATPDACTTYLILTTAAEPE